MQYCPINILTVSSIVIVHTSGASIILTAVTTGYVRPLWVGGKNQIDNNARVRAQLEGESVDILAVDISSVDVELIIT